MRNNIVYSSVFRTPLALSAFAFLISGSVGSLRPYTASAQVVPQCRWIGDPATSLCPSGIRCPAGWKTVARQQCAVHCCPPPPPKKIKPLGAFSRFRFMAEAHNKNRAMHCAPALKWSETLARAADNWAKQCTKTHDQSIRGIQGESLAWGTRRTGEDAVNAWYNERFDPGYNFDAPTWICNDPNNKTVGHFTQLVWRTTTEVGCASRVCGDEVYWVCRYSPPGNINVNTCSANPVSAEVSKQNLINFVPRPCQ
jgi:hypothetical protein